MPSSLCCPTFCCQNVHPSEVYRPLSSIIVYPGIYALYASKCFSSSDLTSFYSTYHKGTSFSSVLSIAHSSSHFSLLAITFPMVLTGLVLLLHLLLFLLLLVILPPQLLVALVVVGGPLAPSLMFIRIIGKYLLCLRFFIFLVLLLKVFF